MAPLTERYLYAARLSAPRRDRERVERVAREHMAQVATQLAHPELGGVTDESDVVAKMPPPWAWAVDVSEHRRGLVDPQHRSTWTAWMSGTLMTIPPFLAFGCAVWMVFYGADLASTVDVTVAVLAASGTLVGVAVTSIFQLKRVHYDPMGLTCDIRRVQNFQPPRAVEQWHLVATAAGSVLWLLVMLAEDKQPWFRDAEGQLISLLSDEISVLALATIYVTIAVTAGLSVWHIWLGRGAYAIALAEIIVGVIFAVVLVVEMRAGTLYDPGFIEVLGGQVFEATNAALTCVLVFIGIVLGARRMYRL